jgi:hypothetical protein
MSDNIKPYHMHEAGNIPGIPGTFGGGQTVYVDLDTRKVVSCVPILPPAITEEPAATDEATAEKLIVEDVSPVGEEG